MKFGVREIVDVVFKATEDGQRIGTKTFKKYQPVFMIDTATTSSLEQATTTVYAQGGKGYARLIAWEGEKTMTFTVTDALMSPMGLAVLTGAGLINPGKDGAEQAHFHLTINGRVKNDNGEVDIKFEDIRDELGLGDMKAIDVCNTIEMYATKLDGSGAGTDWYNNVSIKDASGDYTTVADKGVITFIVGKEATATEEASFAPKNATVQVDFYVIMNNSLTEITIEPSSFGGYFYVEAQTLFRREDSGQDMAAEITIPKAKVQSAFTFTMAASGDPSTFDFVMDAMPGYTRFDSTKKVMCKIQMVGVDSDAVDASAHGHETKDDNESPDFNKPVPPTPPVVSSFDISNSAKVNPLNVLDPFYDGSQPPVNVTEECRANQGAINVSINDDTITLTIPNGTNLETWTSTNIAQAALGDVPWLALGIGTGVANLEGVKLGGETLDPQEAVDAVTWGLNNDCFILWINANDAATRYSGQGREFALSKDGYKNKSVFVKIIDNR